eukprot:gene12244-13505_t
MENMQIKKPVKDDSDGCNNANKRYGWSGIYIKRLQFLNQPVFFLAFLCVVVLAQGMIITGVTSVIVTTIQTRFGFTSVQAGALSSSYDTAYGVSSIFVSFFGHTRKPFLLGVGSIILAIGCFTASVPHYIIGKYHAGVVTDIDWCNLNNTLASTANVSAACKSGEWYYLAIFCIAYITMGLGATPIYILGPSHLDEITKRGQHGLYIGIMYTFATLGPAVGYLIGKPMLSTFVDIKQPKGSNLTPTDSIWVGAWWMGFLVGTAMFLLISIPMLGFPQEFPSTAEIRESKKELEDTVKEDGKLEVNFRSLIPASVALLKNKCYLLISLAVTFEGLATGGFSTFIPKFFESQFFVSASNAALYTGIIVVPGAGGGILLGGYLIKKYNWNCQKTIKMSMIFSLLAFVATASIFIGCGQKEITGVNVPYTGQSTANGIDSSCRLNCTCNEAYKPICTKADNRAFYSACHAGCTRDNTNGNMYYNCTCFPSNITVAEKGGCSPVCSLMYLFMPCFLITMVFTFLNNVPLINATFRVVPESQSSFALGFQQIFVRFLGFIPGPILFGRFVDKACILWQKDQCGSGENRNCLEYNNSLFRYYFYTIGGTFKILSFIFLVFAYYAYTPPGRLESTMSQQDFVLREVAAPGRTDDETIQQNRKLSNVANV